MSDQHAESVAPVRWWKARFAGSARPWFGSDRRCRKWQLGPFNTDWRCLLIHDHATVEGLPHIYEPDIWPGGRYHDQWAGRGGLEVGRPIAHIDGPAATGHAFQRGDNPMFCGTCGMALALHNDGAGHGD